MIPIVSFGGEDYPDFQAHGNMSQYAAPFARHFCKGKGYDIGYGKKEWIYRDDRGVLAIGIEDQVAHFNAYYLPDGDVDYIYSSHCLEHLEDWIDALELWISKLRTPGAIFLYLPHREQKWWLPWNNRKHKHLLDAEMVVDCMVRFGIKRTFHSERDLSHSFIVVGEK